ncbi:MAG: TRAP transporter substrate-binding protein [Candidatus Rokuibacteriota bacterium]
MPRLTLLLPAVVLASVLMPRIADSQATLGPGPKVSISAVTQSIPTLLQWVKVDVPYYREIIPQRSNGRVEVKLSTWAEMNLAGTEILRLTRSGQVDISASPLTYVAGDVPLLDGADLAGLNPTIEQARKVVTALVPVANKELERFNTKIIGTLPFPAQVFWCRKPVKDLADLKSRKIRTFGTSLNDLVGALGAQAVSITFAEVYVALERGVADCGITGTASGNAAKWYEVTSHIYTLPVGWSVTAYYANLAWWNRLDPAVRKFLEDTHKEMEDKQWALGAELTQDGIDCNAGRPTCKLATLVKDRPMTEVKPIEGDKALVKKILTETALPAWVKRCGARCGEIYNEVLAPITGVRYTPR